MNSQFTYQTNNPIVDKMAKMHFSGNVIPEAWYHTIVSENGKTNGNAIHILADIVYWYRPVEIRDEQSNTTTYKKKFSDKDFLQKSYEQLCEKFNLSHKQVRDCLKLLENLGVVKRHFRTMQTSLGCCSNVMYLELVPEVLERLTYPEMSPPSEQGNSYCQNCQYPLPKKKAGDDLKGETYTENTTEIKTEISTTTDPVVERDIKNQLSDMGLNEQDVNAVVKASEGNLSKCQKAVDVLRKQPGEIRNITGWLIKAIRDNYQSVSKPSSSPISFNGFKQNEYDFDELEKRLLAN